MPLKQILELSALILSLVNGSMLLWYYLRDKPKLAVSPVYPDTYQWFFTLPSRKYKNQTTRKYGFLTYIDVINKGIRDVSLESWRLSIKTVGKKWIKLDPVSIPEPQIELGQSGTLKVWQVLGQSGIHHQGDTMIKAGGSVSGFAYYIAEFYGGDAWNPLVKKGKAVGKIVVQSVFGNKARSKILFTEIPLEKAKRIVKDIDKVELYEDTPSNSG